MRLLHNIYDYFFLHFILLCWQKSVHTCFFFFVEMPLKGIVSKDFDCLFMILSYIQYSLDVRHAPLHILFLNLCFHMQILSSRMMLCRSHMCNFIPNSVTVRDKFCTRIRVITYALKNHIWQNLNKKISKFKKRMWSGTCLTSKLYDKIIQNLMRLSL
jgi:hypothetical protein